MTRLKHLPHLKSARLRRICPTYCAAACPIAVIIRITTSGGTLLRTGTKSTSPHALSTATACPAVTQPVHQERRSGCQADIGPGREYVVVTSRTSPFGIFALHRPLHAARPVAMSMR